MSTPTYDDIEQRLLAYILPRKPRTSEQEEAMEDAVEAQLAYEREAGLSGVPGNVSSMSNDGVSVTFTGNIAQLTDDTISPTAWAILRNAGLIGYSLPTARPTRAGSRGGGSRFGR